MSSIGFTHLREMGPLPDILEEFGGTRAVEQVFRAEGLPVSLAYDQTGFVPLRSMIGLIERAARKIGDDLFGLHLGNAMRPTDFGPWVMYVLAAPKLQEMLCRSIRALPYHVSSGTFDLEVDGAYARWRTSVSEPSGLGRRHHTDHLIGPMLTALRFYLGVAWVPAAFEVDYERPACWRALEEQLGAPVIFGRPSSAIVFEARLLDTVSTQSIPLRDIVTFSDLRRNSTAKPPQTFVESVQEVARVRLMDSTVDIEGTASLLGIGVRTLQRLLMEENVTYRDLVERLRMRRALDLIRESREPITDIAFALGYSEIASFTRAFRRCMGFPPSHLRRAPPQRDLRALRF